MLRAWRERDQEKRIKIAHQALEHNAKYVTISTYILFYVIINNLTTSLTITREAR